MSSSLLTSHIGQQIVLSGHFDVPVVLEDARALGSDESAGYECRVRLPDGSLEEAVISADEVASILGIKLMGVKTSDVLESFFRDIVPPRLESALILRKGIARGVSEGIFAYSSGGNPILNDDGKFQVNLDKVILKRPLADDEIDFDSGFLMVPAAVPAVPEVQFSSDGLPDSENTTQPRPFTPADIGVGAVAESPTTNVGLTAQKNRIRLESEATREQVFKAFPAIANLADKSDGAKVRIKIVGISAVGFDPSWIRNAVEEPLDEADIDRITED